MSDLTVADAKADAAAKYDAYREAYSAWWNAVQVVSRLSAAGIAEEMNQSPAQGVGHAH